MFEIAGWRFRDRSHALGEQMANEVSYALPCSANVRYPSGMSKMLSTEWKSRHKHCTKLSLRRLRRYSTMTGSVGQNPPSRFYATGDNHG